MKRFFVYFFSLIILLALNMALPKFYSAAPNFLFLFMVFSALKKDSQDFLWLAFFSGLLLDIFGGTFFGSWTIGFLCVAALINYSIQTLFTADLSLPSVSAIVAAAYLLLTIILFVLSFAVFRLHILDYPISGGIFAAKIWLDLLFNLIFAAPIYYLTEFNDRILLKGER